MANLLNLCPELIIMIVQRITKSEDLFSLRQTCRYLEQCSKPHFLRRYFYERHHMLSRHSLKALSEIVSDAVFGPALHTLVIGTDHLATDTSIEEAFYLRLGAPSSYGKMVTNKSNYERYLANQNTLLSSGLAAAYLTSILSKAVNCKALRIEDRPRAWGANYLKQETGAYPTTDLNHSNGQEFTEKAFEAIFAAVTASAIRLETLEICQGVLRCRLVLKSSLLPDFNLGRPHFLLALPD